MQKILYLITQSEMGGAQVYVKNLSIALKNNYSILVAAGEEKKENWLKQEMETNAVPFTALKYLKRAVSPLNDFLAIFEIMNLIKKETPDIIHLNSSKISILGSLAWRLLPKKSRTRIKVVYTVHGWVFLEPLSISKKTFFLWTEKFTARFKHILICVSRNDQDAALKEKICSTNKLITIHNGINSFAPSEKFDFYIFRKQNLSIKDTKKFQIVTIANLYKTKGLEYLIKSAEILQKESIDFAITIIGEGEERKNLEELINSLNLQNRIFLLGAVPNASRYLNQFDAYVCSSVKEGLSYTVIEAMFAGLPIVATNVGGNSELITENKEGLLVEAKNPEALATAIKFLIEHDDEAKMFGMKAREKAKKEFGLSQMINRTKDVYSNLISKSKIQISNEIQNPNNKIS